jgi:hypothetical protein
MPKRAIIRRTKSVKSGPRSQGGGKVVNGWNCGVLVIYGPGLLLVLGPAAAAVRGVWS